MWILWNYAFFTEHLRTTAFTIPIWCMMSERQYVLNARTQTDIRILYRNAEFYSFIQTAIRFFTTRYEILQLHSNGHSFFIAKYKNLQLYPDGYPFFLQRNTKFWKLYPNGHPFFKAKYKILHWWLSGYNFKILYFAVKKQMAAWAQH